MLGWLRRGEAIIIERLRASCDPPQGLWRTSQRDRNAGRSSVRSGSKTRRRRAEGLPDRQGSALPTFANVEVVFFPVSRCVQADAGFFCDVAVISLVLVDFRTRLTSMESGRAVPKGQSSEGNGRAEDGWVICQNGGHS